MTMQLPCGNMSIITILKEYLFIAAAIERTCHNGINQTCFANEE